MKNISKLGNIQFYTVHREPSSSLHQKLPSPVMQIFKRFSKTQLRALKTSNHSGNQMKLIRNLTYSTQVKNKIYLASF